MRAQRDGALRNVVPHRHIKGSMGMSAFVWLESSRHRALRLYANNVARFVVRSALFWARFAEWGLDIAKLVHIPNFVDLDPAAPDAPPGDTFISFGARRQSRPWQR